MSLYFHVQWLLVYLLILKPCVATSVSRGLHAHEDSKTYNVSNTTDAFEVPTATLKLLCPRGLRIWINHTGEISFVAFHVSINKPLHGATPSEYSIDLGRPTANQWQYDLTDVYLNRGDRIFYWIHIVHETHSHVKTDLMWTVPGTGCSVNSSTQFQCSISPTVTPKGHMCSGQLIFEDEFNMLNLETWQHEISASGGRDSEFQTFVNNRRNSFVQDGILHIRPSLTSSVQGEDFLYNGLLDLRGSSQPGERCTNPSNNGCYKQALGAQILNPVISAQIQTVESFSFQYGVVKVRAKMPRGDWLWPAIQLLPLRSAYGAWPSSGQIDIAQSRGNGEFTVDGEPMGLQRVETAVIFGPKMTAEEVHQGTIKKYLKAKGGQDWGSNFHDFEVEWTPEHLQFLVDGDLIMTVTPPTDGGLWALGRFNPDIYPKDPIYHQASRMAPFDQQFYLAIRLAVGGTSGYFPDNTNTKPYPKPWNNTSPTAVLDFWEKKEDWYPTWNEDQVDFQIDYIRVWALP